MGGWVGGWRRRRRLNELLESLLVGGWVRRMRYCMCIWVGGWVGLPG